MKIIDESKLDFCDVMIRPVMGNINSRADVNLSRTFKFKHSPKTLTCVPIIAANMDTIGTFAMAKVLQNYQILTALHKFYSVSAISDAIDNGLNSNYLAFTTGIRDADFIRLEYFKESPISQLINIIMIDVPNGYIKAFADNCKKIRKMFPTHIIMAGNIVTTDMTAQLLNNCGIDVVKVGIGPGKACLTRSMTGVGYPQLSAVIETAKEAHIFDGHVISDGGCKTSGDIAKALGAGADFVMIGSMLAGHDECGGEIIYDQISLEEHVPKYMKFYGMSSTEAMEKYYGKVAAHQASEGKTILVDHKGPVENTIKEILGGLRSACTYVGAKNIEELDKLTTFVKVK